MLCPGLRSKCNVQASAASTMSRPLQQVQCPRLCSKCIVHIPSQQLQSRVQFVISARDRPKIAHTNPCATSVQSWDNCLEPNLWPSRTARVIQWSHWSIRCYSINVIKIIRVRILFSAGINAFMLACLKCYSYYLQVQSNSFFKYFKIMTFDFTLLTKSSIRWYISTKLKQKLLKDI